MNKLKKLSNRLQGLTKAVGRFPITSLFLLAAACIIWTSIYQDELHSKLILASFVGAMMCATIQVIWERFFTKELLRFSFLAGGILLTVGYYLVIRSVDELTIEIGVRTTVALFALFFAFIWGPVIKSRYTFNESFMVVFKAFFLSLFYSAILFGGCSLILVAIDVLITNISENAYGYTADIIFVIFAPVFFLSMIPVYPGKKEEFFDEADVVEEDERIAKASGCPRFLEVLISYIIIPLTGIYMIILLLYIVLNIRGEFWSDNLLEPLLVTYAITVILVSILSSRLENAFARFYRKIFPKILVPMVLFQIVSSVLSLSDTGITHTRYFVIVFGIFAVASGVVLSVFDVKRNGLIAAFAIVFSFISILPPVDAFTISRISQTNRLEKLLVQNDMLETNQILPREDVSDETKNQIAASVEYLSMMKYTDQVSFMPKDFQIYEDFLGTFGFNQYDLEQTSTQAVYVYRDNTDSISVEGYDILLRNTMSGNKSSGDLDWSFQYLDQNYTLKKEANLEFYDLVLFNQDSQEIIRFPISDVYQRYETYVVENSSLSEEDATFTLENDEAKITLVVQEANIYTSFQQSEYYFDYYILIDLK